MYEECFMLTIWVDGITVDPDWSHPIAVLECLGSKSEYRRFGADFFQGRF